MTIELTEEQKEIVLNALLKFNWLYEDKSERACKAGNEQSGAFWEYANKIYLTYQAVKEQ